MLIDFPMAKPPNARSPILSLWHSSAGDLSAEPISACGTSGEGQRGIIQLDAVVWELGYLNKAARWLQGYKAEGSA